MNRRDLISSWAACPYSDLPRLSSKLITLAREADLAGITALWRDVRDMTDPHRRLHAVNAMISVTSGQPAGWQLRQAQMMVDLLEAEPLEPRLWAALGVSLGRLGHRAGAQAALQASVLLEPDDPEFNDALTSTRRIRKTPVGRDVKQVADAARRLASKLTVPDPADMRLTVAMIVRDEQDMIGDCLRSVSGVADEIIVVDTGSEDDTITIAREHGATVVQFAWTGSFSDARNVSLEHATGDWVLILDADERLKPEEHQQLRQLLGRTWKEVMAFTEVNFTGSSESGGQATHRAHRLFRNRPHYRYEGDIHEQVAFHMPLSVVGRVEQTDLHILHYGYLKDRSRQRNKRERNFTMLKQAVERDPSPYHRFQLGSELLALGDFDEARAHLSSVWEEIKADDLTTMSLSWVPLLVGRLCEACRGQGDLEAADHHAAEGLRQFPLYTDLLLLRAVLAREAGALHSAERYARQALEQGDAPAAFTGAVGSGTFLARIELGEILEAQDDRHGAREQWKAALADAPHVPGPVGALARSLLRDMTADQVAEELSDVAQAGGAAGLVLFASALCDTGHYQPAVTQFRRAIDQDPGSHLAWAGLIDSLIACDDIDDAANACDMACAQAIDHVSSRRLMLAAIAGVPFADREQVSPADIEFWDAYQTGSDTPVSAPAALAGATTLPLLLAAQRFTEAEKVMTLCKNSKLDPLSTHTLLARMLTRAGYLQSAEDEWLELIDTCGPVCEAVFGLADLARVQGFADRAEELISQASEMHPDHPLVRHHLVSQR